MTTCGYTGPLMQAVGIRELKAKLSHYVRVAKTGEVVLVTEHGKVVAALGPPRITEPHPELAGLQALIARGLAVPGEPRRSGSYPRTNIKLPPETAAAELDAVREER